MRPFLLLHLPLHVVKVRHATHGHDFIEDVSLAVLRNVFVKRVMVTQGVEDLIPVSLAHNLELFDDDVYETDQFTLSRNFRLHHLILRLEGCVCKARHHCADRATIILLKHLHVALEFVIDAELLVN